MEAEIYKLTQEIRALIEKDPIYLEFLEASNELENSDDVKILSYRKDRASFEYEDAFKIFGKNAAETLMKSKELSEAIYNLNQNPIVKRCNIALRDYNALLKEIEDEILEGIYVKG